MSFREKIRQSVLKWLKLNYLEERVEIIEGDIYQKDAMLRGFAVPKEHLQPPSEKSIKNNK
jgi:hypothetical protein